MLFYLAMPFVMLALLLAAEASIFKLFRSRHAAIVGVRDRLGGSTMVVCFFFMPSILRSTFGWFACIPIDAPVAAPYAAGAVDSFWLHDPGQLCYQGYHRAWAFGLGLPLLVVVCGLLPGVILWTALRNKHRLIDASFVRHYGFLVRSYKPAYCWWEAAVLIQMAVLTAIGVFSYSLRPLQEWVMNLTLAAVVVLLLACKPYAQPAAGRTMLLGVYCLLLTSMGLWSFSAFQGFVPGVIYRTVVGALLLLVNLAFVVSVLWQIARIVVWPGVRDRLSSAWASVGAICARAAQCTALNSKPARVLSRGEEQ
jgi:hypothetical protein